MHPSVPATTLKQFVALAKSRPGEIAGANATKIQKHKLRDMALQLVRG